MSLNEKKLVNHYRMTRSRSSQTPWRDGRINLDVITWIEFENISPWISAITISEQITHKHCWFRGFQALLKHKFQACQDNLLVFRDIKGFLQHIMPRSKTIPSYSLAVLSLVCPYNTVFLMYWRYGYAGNLINLSESFILVMQRFDTRVKLLLWFLFRPYLWLPIISNHWVQYCK